MDRGGWGAASPKRSWRPGPRWSSAAAPNRRPTTCPPATGAGPSSWPPTSATPIRRPAVVTQTTERFGRLDVLVNNAGGAPAVPAADASARFISQVIALNLVAPFYCAQAANRVMQDQGTGGSIVNIASVSGLRPSPGTRRLRRRQGRAHQPDPDPGHGMGARGAGELHRGRHDRHRGGRGPLRGPRRPAARWPPPSLSGGWAPRPTSPAICLFLASPLASYLSGAAVEAHGGGEWPPFLAAVDSVR